MEARRRTWFDERGLVVATGGGERRLPYLAGALAYSSLSPAQWAPCLRQLHALGLTCVDAVVPWRVHEPEALSHEAVPGFAEGDVVEVLRKGYSFKDRLLRPALVKVAKGPEATGGPPAEKVH